MAKKDEVTVVVKRLKNVKRDKKTGEVTAKAKVVKTVTAENLVEARAEARKWASKNGDNLQVVEGEEE